MRKIYLFAICQLLLLQTFAQTTGQFTVQGDATKYYPVSFSDALWANHRPTELSIGRSTIHTNAMWHGSLIANFTYHINNWGHGSSFIDANIIQTGTPFIAGWEDPTGNNDFSAILI